MSRENEIKAMFDAEFSAADIFVTEDLIARTMAAIDKEKTDGQENRTEQTGQTEQTGRVAANTGASKKRTFIKWASGIAAAMLVGVIGITVIRSAGISKSEDSNTAVQSFRYDSDNGVYSEKSDSATADSVDEDRCEISAQQEYSKPAETVEAAEASEAKNERSDNNLFKMYDGSTFAAAPEYFSVQTEPADDSVCCDSEVFSNSFEPDITELAKEDFDGILNTALSLCVLNEVPDVSENGGSGDPEIPETTGDENGPVRIYCCRMDDAYEELVFYGSYMTYTKTAVDANGDGIGGTCSYGYSVPLEKVLEEVDASEKY